MEVVPLAAGFLFLRVNGVEACNVRFLDLSLGLVVDVVDGVEVVIVVIYIRRNGRLPQGRLFLARAELLGLGERHSLKLLLLY